MNFKIENLHVNRILLDESNPRFPSVNSQREAIELMITSLGEKIANLAEDIFLNGLNPSSRLIVFRDGQKFIDGDGNRRLSALKILNMPSLADSNPKVRRRLDQILKQPGELTNEVECVVFENRESARHWIAINHGGELDGRGQINWNPEQKDRFEKRPSIGLEAMDLLVHRRLLNAREKEELNKSTLDRLLSYKNVRKSLNISEKNGHSTFGNIDNLAKIVRGLRGVKVDSVYTALKADLFVQEKLAAAPSDSEHIASKDTGFVENAKLLPSAKGSRSRIVQAKSFEIFGRSRILQTGATNNLYRSIEHLYGFYKAERRSLSEDFVVLIRMSLRLLAERAATEKGKKLKPYLIENFDTAKATLTQDEKTSLSNLGVKKESIIQLLHTGAHEYANSRNEEQAIAISIIVGAIIQITHGKKS